MRYSWVSPQEDEFALLAMGAPSPYEALIVASRMRDAKSLLDFRYHSREDIEQWRETFQYFLRLLTVQQGKRMVLKSPTHGFRLPTLASLFPRSCYVIIERNPYEVFASNLNLWRTLLGLYSLESISEEEIEEFVLAAYVLHEEAIARGLAKVEPSSLARIRFEDLVSRPVEEMTRIYAKLDLGDMEPVLPKLEEYAVRMRDHKRNQFQLSPLQKARVDMVWGKFIEMKGYSYLDRYVNAG